MQTRNYTDVEMMFWVDGEEKIDLSKITTADLEAAQIFIESNVIIRRFRRLREQYDIGCDDNPTGVLSKYIVNEDEEKEDE